MFAHNSSKLRIYVRNSPPIFVVNNLNALTWRTPFSGSLPHSHFFFFTSKFLQTYTSQNYLNVSVCVCYNIYICIYTSTTNNSLLYELSYCYLFCDLIYYKKLLHCAVKVLIPLIYKLISHAKYSHSSGEKPTWICRCDTVAEHHSFLRPEYYIKITMDLYARCTDFFCVCFVSKI